MHKWRDCFLQPNSKRVLETLRSWHFLACNMQWLCHSYFLDTRSCWVSHLKALFITLTTYGTPGQNLCFKLELGLLWKLKICIMLRLEAWICDCHSLEVFCGLIPFRRTSFPSGCLRVTSSSILGLFRKFSSGIKRRWQMVHISWFDASFFTAHQPSPPLIREVSFLKGMWGVECFVVKQNKQLEWNEKGTKKWKEEEMEERDRDSTR